MNRKPKNTDEPIATKYLEKEKQETERHDTNTLILASVVASLMFIFMSIINVYKHSPMLFSTVFGAVFFMAAAAAAWRTRRKSVGIAIIAVTVAVIFSWYAVVGGNDGFAILWILLVPSVSLLAFGFREGIFLSVYFALFLAALFYTPLRRYVQYDYGEIFMFRFPILYFVDVLTSLIGFRMTNKYQAENRQYKLKLLSYNDVLKKEVKAQTVKVENFSRQLISALAKTIDAKDQYTNGHSERVAKYARMLAGRMGKDEQEQEKIYNIGMLHDIGKIGISGEIINKTTKLTDEEYEIIKTHPLIGAGILENISEIPEIATGARWHHERYDGKGYPDGLKGKDIPEIARIIGVADAYDAMASNRSYRKVLPQEAVRSEIEKGKGTQFDPEIADLMLKLIDEDTEYRLREDT